MECNLALEYRLQKLVGWLYRVWQVEEYWETSDLGVLQYKMKILQFIRSLIGCQ